MGKLILHIGMPKTGTTSLQAFLLANRRSLEGEGFAYPLFSRQEGRDYARNGIFLRKYCQSLGGDGTHGGMARNPERNLRLLKQSVDSYPAVILSDEVFFTASSSLAGKKAPARTAIFWDAVAQRLQAIGVTSVTLVVYLRRQDSFLSSNWRQLIKSRPFKLTRQEYLSMHMRRNFLLDYRTRLSAIEDALAAYMPIDMRVRPYETSKFVAGSSYCDFCTAAGIPWRDDYSIPSDKNISLSFDVAEAMRRMEDLPKQHTFLRNMLIKESTRLSQLYPDAPGAVCYTPEEAKILLSLHEEGNREIAYRYLGGEELFSSDDRKHPVWEPDEERIASIKGQLERFLERTPNLQRLWDTDAAFFLGRVKNRLSLSSRA